MTENSSTIVKCHNGRVSKPIYFIDPSTGNNFIFMWLMRINLDSIQLPSEIKIIKTDVIIPDFNPDIIPIPDEGYTIYLSFNDEEKCDLECTITINPLDNNPEVDYKSINNIAICDSIIKHKFVS
ncbi:MAG TPA: hypothetical protein VGF79_06770 [Bacteroidia bacterium]